MTQPTVEIRTYSGEVERHRHAFHQVVLPCTGALEIEIEARAGRVAGGLGSCVAADRAHTFLAPSASRFVVLDLPCETEAGAFACDAAPAFFGIGRDLQGLIDDVALRGSEAPVPPTLAAAWAALILDRIVDRPAGPAPTELAIRRALRFMAERLADPIRVADIARAAGISTPRRHDAFLCRRTTTPHAHLMALRLDAAEGRLAEGGLSIAEIARRTGHADQAALTRAMRRKRGTTPARFRRSLKPPPRENA